MKTYTLVEIPKIKKGQKINLVQVTGKAASFQDMSLFETYFHTPEGTIKIKGSKLMSLR